MQWPSLYWAKVRVFNVKKEEEEEQWLAFLLPHEILDCLAKYGDVSKLHSTARLDVVGQQHLENCEGKAQKNWWLQVCGVMVFHATGTGQSLWIHLVSTCLGWMESTEE